MFYHNFYYRYCTYIFLFCPQELLLESNWHRNKSEISFSPYTAVKWVACRHNIYRCKLHTKTETRHDLKGMKLYYATKLSFYLDQSVINMSNNYLYLVLFTSIWNTSLKSVTGSKNTATKLITYLMVWLINCSQAASFLSLISWKTDCVCCYNSPIYVHLATMCCGLYCSIQWGKWKLESETHAKATMQKLNKLLEGKSKVMVCRSVYFVHVWLYSIGITVLQRLWQKMLKTSQGILAHLFNIN